MDYARYENNIKYPSTTLLESVLNALNMDLDEVIVDPEA